MKARNIMYAATLLGWIVLFSFDDSVVVELNA